MKLLRIAAWALALVLATTAHADAAPIAAAIGAIAGLIKAGGIIGSLIQLALGLALNLGISLLQRALQKKPDEPGVRVQVEIGDDHPGGFVVGHYATPGTRRYAGSYGQVGKTPNSFLIEVIQIGDISAPGLPGVWVNGEKVTVLWDEPDADGFCRVEEYRRGDWNHLWVKYVDGTQTASDSFMLDTFGDDPDRPWTSDMVGRGAPYVIMRARFNRDLFRGGLNWLFEPPPIPLYDVRKDSTAGGSGSHRWNDQSTWEPTLNPVVISYNILRGIYYDDGTTREWMFGGQDLPAWRLPAANWMAAMNEADAAIPLEGGGTEPQFRCGYEIRCDMDPLNVVEELMKGCLGTVVEVGGRFKVHIGAPAAPVYSFTDGDVLITEGQSFKPFNSISDTINAIEATAPFPEEAWRMRDVPSLYDKDLEEEDGGRRLPVGIQFPTVPYPIQCQRLMKAMLQDARKMRVHVLPMPPDASMLEPGVDTVAWTSERTGYIDKKFTIERIVGRRTRCPIMIIREVDPSDYDWSPGDQQPVPPPVWTGPIRPPVQPATGVQVFPDSIDDNNGKPRRPTFGILYPGDLDDVQNVAFQVKLDGDADDDLQVDGQFPYGGISDDPKYTKVNNVFTGNADLEVRVKWLPFSGRLTDWSDWLPVTTPDIRTDDDDLDKTPPGPVTGLTMTSAGFRTLALSWTNPTSANFRHVELWYSTGTSFAAAVHGGNFAGQSGIVQLPNTGTLYRIWARAVSFAGVAQVTPTGPVTGTTLLLPGEMIQDEAVSANKIMTDAVTSIKLAAEAVEAAKIATGAVLSSKLADNAVITSKIADGAVLTSKLADGVMTIAKFATGLRPVELLGALPETGNFAGRLVFLTTDGKLYRHTGSPAGAAGFTAEVNSGDITGQLTSSQIESIVASKVTGQLTSSQIESIVASKVTGQLTNAQIETIVASKVTGQLTSAQIESLVAGKITGQLTTTQISDAGITTPKIAANAVVADKIAANAVTAVKILAGAVETDKIAANAVNADKIAANAVTAVKILAGAVETDKIAANAVNADKIAANAVTAVKILAGAVETDKLAANSVTSDKIVANAITAVKILAGSIETDKLAANAVTTAKLDALAVTADKLAANSVIAGKIQAGAVTASEIAAGSIAARHLLIMDWENLVPDNQLQDLSGSWELGSGWGSSTPSGSAWKTPRTLFYTYSGGSGLSSFARNTRIAVEPDVEYLFTFQASRGAGTGAVFVAVRWRDNAGTAISDSTVYSGDAGLVVTRSANLTAPAGAQSAEFLIYVNLSATNGNVQVGGIGCFRRKNSELIVDGAITADKIEAGSVTTGKVAAGAITANELAVGAVTAEKIVAGAVTAVKIQAGTITGDKIAANTIAGEKIVAGSITARELIIANFDNLCINGGFEGGSISPAVATSGSWALSTGVLRSGQGAVRNAQSGSQAVLTMNGGVGVENGQPDVRAGEMIYFEAYALRSGTGAGSAFIQILWYNAAGTLINATSSPVPSLTTDWQRISVTGTAPPNAASCTFRLVVSAGATTPNVWFDDVYARRMQDGRVIIDGTVIADKIAALAITADKIATGAITTAKLDAGAVTADKIATNAVTADKIQANAVTAAKINVTSLQAISATLGSVNISDAVIGTLIVDTLNLGPNAATQSVSVTAEYNGALGPNTNPFGLITAPAQTKFATIYINGTLTFQALGGSPTGTVTLRVYKNGEPSSILSPIVLGGPGSVTLNLSIMDFSTTEDDVYGLHASSNFTGGTGAINAIFSGFHRAVWFKR